MSVHDYLKLPGDLNRLKEIINEKNQLLIQIQNLNEKIISNDTLLKNTSDIIEKKFKLNSSQIKDLLDDKDGIHYKNLGKALYQNTSNNVDAKLGNLKKRYSEDEVNSSKNKYQASARGLNYLATSSKNPQQPMAHQKSSHSDSVKKSEREKLDAIAIELEDYQIELTILKPGCGKKDKHYLKLEEFLTRCLLKLDEIEKTDDIIALRKSLIVESNKLLDKLETIALNSCDRNFFSSFSGKISFTDTLSFD